MAFPPINKANALANGTGAGEIILRIQPQFLRCKLCDCDFVYLSELHDHWDSGTAHIYCRKCNLHFRTLGELYDHVADPKYHLVCRLCPDFHDFDSLGGLRKHLLDKHRDVYCSLCNILFENDSFALQVHALELHQSCKLCGLRFASEAELRTHLKTSDGHVFTFCFQCEYDCHDEEGFREHLDIHQLKAVFRHPDRVPEVNLNYVKPPDLPCFACGPKHSFALASSLIQHLEDRNCPSRWTPQAVHYLAVNYPHSLYYINPSHGTLLYGVKRWKRSTLQHARGGPWACTNCKAVAWTWPTALAHLTTAACASMPLPVFKCPGCTDRFSKLSGLIAHCEKPCPKPYGYKGQTRDRIINGILVYIKNQLAFRNHVLLEIDFSKIVHVVQMVSVGH